MRLLNPPRQMWRPVVAILAGAALFASGAFVANAFDDGDDTPDKLLTANRDGASTTFPGYTGFPGAGSNASMGDDAGRGAYPAAEADAALTRPWGGCQVPIPGALSDGKLDPSAVGVTARYLGSAFELTGFTIRGETDCWSESPTGETVIVVDTQWKHTDSDLNVYVSQRQDTDAQANVLDEMSARFWQDGYAFWVSVDGYGVQPLAGDDGREPGIAPGPDPRAGEVLRAALADLSAPAEACFYVARQGGFEDLAALGIGDPRTAIPSGFTLDHVYVQTWSDPDPGCNTPSEGLQASFNASWTSAGDVEYGGIYVGAYAVAPGEQPYPGSAGPWGANWSNGTYQFNVGAKMESALDAAVVTAIARALDPGFDNACMARERSLSESELAALGINTPTVPDGYTVAHANMVTTELSGNCSSEARANFREFTHAEWNLRGPEGAVIDVRANKAPDIPPEEKGNGFINENGLWWWSDAGVQYEVFGYVDGRAAFPPQDVLIAIAQSLDPALDVDSLEKNGAGRVIPPSIPPAQDLPAQAAGAGSDGNAGSR